MGKARKTALLKALAREWGDWNDVPITEEMRSKYPHLKHVSKIWGNHRYEVQAFTVETSIGGVWQLGIIRHGDIEKIEWEELQRIVHELYGPEVTAVEIYPPLVDEWQTKHNLRVLWILPATWPLPFGLGKKGAWGKPA